MTTKSIFVPIVVLTTLLDEPLVIATAEITTDKTLVPNDPAYCCIMLNKEFWSDFFGPETCILPSESEVPKPKLKPILITM